MLESPQDLAQAPDFPVMTELLLGSPLRSITLIVLARDEAAVAAAMRAAGWTVSAPPGAGRIVDALWSAIEGREDPTVETVAHFWRGQPNALAFGDSPAERDSGPRDGAEARFWRTEYVTAEGLRVFVATCGHDESSAPAADAAGPDGREVQDCAAPGLLQNGATQVARLDLSASPASPQEPSVKTSSAAVLRLR